jgi:hypothetical protein
MAKNINEALRLLKLYTRETFDIYRLAGNSNAKFCIDNAKTLADAIETGEVSCGPDFDEMGRAGHDFWLTRCGHGAGFWDGDWPEPYATMLTDAAKAFGEVDLYVGDDGMIYS